MSDLTNRMRKASKAVYLATDEVIADDLSALLLEAIAVIETPKPDSEWVSVDSYKDIPDGDWIVMEEGNDGGPGKMHVAEIKPNISTVGSLFAFDLGRIYAYKPAGDMPLPQPPKDID